MKYFKYLFLINLLYFTSAYFLPTEIEKVTISQLWENTKTIPNLNNVKNFITWMAYFTNFLKNNQQSTADGIIGDYSRTKISVKPLAKIYDLLIPYNISDVQRKDNDVNYWLNSLRAVALIRNELFNPPAPYFMFPLSLDVLTTPDEPAIRNWNKTIAGKLLDLIISHDRGVLSWNKIGKDNHIWNNLEKIYFQNTLLTRSQAIEQLLFLGHLIFKPDITTMNFYESLISIPDSMEFPSNPTDLSSIGSYYQMYSQQLKNYWQSPSFWQRIKNNKGRIFAIPIIGGLLFKLWQRYKTQNS